MIEARNLTKSFGRLTAVTDVSFRVEAGEVFAFLGPNGAGKTTTIRMLTTLLAPTSGSIRIDGLDAIREPRRVRNSFGIVFQDPSLDGELTARENLELHGVFYGVARREARERGERLLEEFELWEHRNRRAKLLSGGMKRRLEVARAFMHMPKILFMDEPTLGLDPQSRNKLWQHMQALRSSCGTTFFLTTHYMDEAERLADRVAIIDHGRIVCQDTPAGLMSRTGTRSLEAAFLSITGFATREESGDILGGTRELLRARARR
jgi:ABC-2 type transport system ATP-binding protein